MPKMHPVSSSNITHIGYDEPSRELHVTFSSGKTYAHSDVSAQAHADLMAAGSKGSHYSAHIRGKYPSRIV